MAFDSFKPDDGYNVSETGNWNVAKDYSKLKIMKQLYLSDDYATIAIFGTSTLLEELESSNPIDYMKIKGFERLVHCLLMLCSNTLFAVRKGKSKDKVKKIRDELERIQKIIPLLSRVVRSTRKNTSALVIKPEKYEEVLNRVLHLKTSLNQPLNQNDLIFTETEEFDPIAYKKKIMDDASTRG